MVKLTRRQFVASVLAAGVLRRAPSFALAQTQSISILRSPYLQATRSDGVRILWATLQSGNGYVQYANNGVIQTVQAAGRTFLPQETGLPFSFVQYEAVLAGLTPNTDYTYVAAVDGQSIGNPAGSSFRTAGPGAFDFLVFGDSGQATPDQAAIASAMAGERPSFALHAGDIAYMLGTFDQFNTNYFGYYGNLMGRFPFFPTPGNHDYMTGNAAPYIAVHSVPRDTVPLADQGRYYSFDWGNAHFVSLDSNLSLEQASDGTGPMLDWLEQDLSATNQFWRIVYFHHPPYATGVNTGDIHCALARERIAPILERHGVQLVFSGHEHSYQRSNFIRDNGIAASGDGTVYVTSGGGGAALYGVAANPLLAFSKSEYHYIRAEVRGTQLTFRAIRSDGSEVDACTLAPPPVIAENGSLPVVWFRPNLGGQTAIYIQGRALGADTQVAPTSAQSQLGGTSVTLNGQPVSLFSVSSNQISGWLPADLSGPITLQVQTANGTAESFLRLPRRSYFSLRYPNLSLPN